MSANGWTTVAFGDVVVLRRDGEKVNPRASYPNLGIYSYGRGVFAKPPIEGAVTSAPTLFRVHAGQFIYSKLFAFEGAFALVPHEMDGWFVSNEYPTFDVDTKQVSPEFLRLVICRPSVWANLAGRTVGMGHRRQRLKPEALLEYELELPSRDEQHRIVRAVQAADAAVVRARRLAERASAFLHAFRERHLVEGGEWRESDGWELATLSDYCEVSLGFTKGRRLVGPTKMTPYLRAVNVQDGYIALKDVAEIEAAHSDFERYALRAHDVLLLEGGNPEHVGRSWIWDGAINPCLHQNSTLRARPLDPDRVSARFVAWALGASPARSFCLEQATQTSGVAHLGLSGARDIPLVLPPRAEQDAIVSRLDDAREVLVGAVRKVESHRRMRDALVETLVSGSRRLRETLTA